MDKKKLAKQLAVIALMIALFAGLDFAIYQLFIKRVISHHSPGMQKMSVEVDNYVPFTGSENLVSVPGVVTLEGDIPTIDLLNEKAKPVVELKGVEESNEE